MLSRTLLASLLSVSALGAMPSGAGAVFATSSPTAHPGDGTSIDPAHQRVPGHRHCHLAIGDRAQLGVSVRRP